MPLATQMPQLTESRWQFLSASSEAECFTVFDSLARKNRTYYVPYLDHVEVSDCMAHVYTSNTKIMRLNLLTSARSFTQATL
jgi:hypothetical protein